MIDLFIATGNLHKLAEFNDILRAADAPVRVQGASAVGGMPPVEETGKTFSENAHLKAEALLKRAPQGAWVLADDSGLEVKALGGAPGVHSARYAGAHGDDGANTAKLLAALEKFSDDQREARFVCSLCLMGPGGQNHVFNGICKGRIARTPSGKGGFGYDPVFIPEGYKHSFADLGDDVKNALSHRGNAAVALAAFLKARFGELCCRCQG